MDTMGVLLFLLYFDTAKLKTELTQVLTDFQSWTRYQKFRPVAGSWYFDIGTQKNQKSLKSHKKPQKIF